MDRKKYDAPKINKIEELTAQLLVANETLKRSELQRTQMLENISHDLRAPISAIRSSIDYLTMVCQSDTIDTDSVSHVVGLLDARTRTLEGLIRDLYYLTSMEGNHSTFIYERIPAGAFLEDYYFTTQLDEKYADKNLELKVPERFPYEIRIDTARMTRVLDNLFTNAARYSGQGADITLGAEYDGEDVRIYVEDTGDGIASDQIPHIFERSYKASSARTPSGNSGSGLGLAIAKEIIEKHKGSITCTSQLGKGSRFTVILPSLRNH